MHKLDELPPELILNVLEMLTQRDGLSLGSVCQRLHSILPQKHHTHLHFNLTDDNNVPSHHPNMKVIGWKDIKKFYELLLGQGFDGPIMKGVTKLTFTVADSIYKIPLIKAPASPIQVSRYPNNFLALTLLNNVIPKHCINVRYIGVHVLEYRTCPRFIFSTVSAFQSQVQEINVYTSGEQLPIPSRQKLNATHLTLSMENYAMVPAFVNKSSVTKLTIDCSQKVVDCDRLRIVLNKLTMVKTLRIKANAIRQDILKNIPSHITNVELDVRRVKDEMELEYPNIQSIKLSDNCDARLNYNMFPNARFMGGAIEDTTDLSKVVGLNCEGSVFLDRIAAPGTNTSALEKLVLGATYFGDELLAIKQCENLKQLYCVCKEGDFDVFAQALLLSSRQLVSLSVYCPTMPNTLRVYTGKVLNITNSVERFEHLLGATDNTAYSDDFRPYWQPVGRPKRASKILS